MTEYGGPDVPHRPNRPHWPHWPHWPNRPNRREVRYHFDVAAQLPLVGLLVRYRGWLEVAE